MDQTARGWLVYSMTHSPMQLGLVTAARGVPLLVFGLVAGVVADRYSRKIQLTVSAATEAFLSLVLATLVFTGRVEVWHIYVTGVLAGTAQAFSTPARMALVNDLVPKDKLLNPVALMSAAFNVARGIGPALAGLLITYFGVSGSYYVEAVLAASAAIFTLQIKVPEAAKAALRRQAQAKASYVASTLEGLRYVASDRLMLGLMILCLAPMVLAMPFTSLFPLFAVDILKVDAVGQGLLLSSLGVGALAGALAIASRKGGPIGKTMLLGAIAFGLALCFFAYSPWMVFSMAMTFVAGVANTTFTTQNQTAVQLMAPSHLRGRILSIYLTNRALTPIGTSLAGILATFFGGPGAVLIMGLSTIALVVVLWAAVPRIAAMGTPEAASTSPSEPPQ